MKLEIELIEARLRAPFVTARTSVNARRLGLVRLETADGQVGYGEAAPLEGYDAASLDHVLAALEDCREPLSQSDGQDREALTDECARRAVLPHATAAIDLALWDLEGRRRGLPVWQLLGARTAPEVEVNATIAAADRAGAATEAVAAREAGFRTIKLKAAVGDDAGRIAAVRAVAGPDMRIRLDANGAWSVPEAQAALRALAPAGVELCEEPVHGLAQTEQLRELTDVPIAIDETTQEPGALDRRVCDAVCLKIARGGGISGVIEQARRARAAGYEVYLASTLDGPLGIAAALHAAAAIKPDRPCGLATLTVFADRDDPLPAAASRIAAPAGPGLGDGLVDWY
ncbi:MAG TPA: enolase C-terminal domain-like protein [Solirubrobacteraceae bacterium]|nr:enolase C-terminal domain-like protein [Solirubrobacteraceae bacterium]